MVTVFHLPYRREEEERQDMNREAFESRAREKIDSKRFLMHIFLYTHSVKFLTAESESTVEN